MDQGPYERALKEFIMETIRNPAFFRLNREWQKEIAKSFVDKYKSVIKKA